jgi:cytidine deaminase
MFSTTHYSIRVVVAAAVKYKHYALMGDALSLAREQVEKVFIVASLLDNPDQACRQYMRSSWKTEYEKFLLEKEEHAENERFEEFLKDTTPKRLERMRRNLVSKFAMRVLKFS